MVKALHRVIYKPDSTSTDEYMVVVEQDEYKRWLEGRSVALAMVVDSFEVFHSGQGSQGRWGRPSKQQLETIFGSSKEDDVVKLILEKGELKAGDSFQKELPGLNNSRGGASIDTRGSAGGLRG
ncbi:DUF1960-domain-containing protein [Exidia glandulosa HHB12029]|uniref:DUF1960-domain-containing protein n=1 Tax=Exidia glandulosa HHB12029 TaxID=1314781 RepID=A0A165QX08_EXIGL|nr:DUF1960-domain-containing protein [Exidia glandulosa HHB12029]